MILFTYLSFYSTPPHETLATMIFSILGHYCNHFASFLFLLLLSPILISMSCIELCLIPTLLHLDEFAYLTYYCYI